MKAWVINELKGIEIGDQRLNARCGNIVNNLSTSPDKSIPEALETWKETKAAYRFFSNSKVNEEKVLKAHIDASKDRIRKEDTVLLLQDTTDIDYSKHQGLTDMGFLGEKKIKYRHGFFLHPTIAVTPNKVNLGVVHNIIWKRDKIGTRELRKVVPIEKKESYNWLLSYHNTQELAKQIPATQFINIGDKEGDIYEFFQAHNPEISNANFIVRSGRDRRTTNKDLKVWEQLSRAEVITNVEFEIPRGWHKPGGKSLTKRAGRTVVQEVRALEVELISPARHTPKLNNCKLCAVMAREINTQKVEDKIEWILLTSLPVTSAQDAIRIIQYYICRWQIELYFKTLKSGCKIESRQLETYDRLKSLLAIYMIIAWRIQYITMFVRAGPDQPCNVVFGKSEWQSVYMVVKRSLALPAQAPSIYQMIRMIAQLGGFLGRKNDGEPGLKTIWLGMQKMEDYSLAWELLYSQAKTCG
jgi:IS4 transposase